eukprot:scaffold1424_cov111-Isochrysis_galbana.AAC.1
MSLNRQKSLLGSSRFYWEDGNVCVAVGQRKKLVRLKKPRLPSASALGLSGACGVVAYTLASLSTLTPLSPLTPYRPPHSYSCTDGSYKPEGGNDTSPETITISPRP